MNKKKVSEKKKNLRVVLIEDDDIMCDLISDFLNDEGYVVEICNSIEDADGKVKAEDILIVDVKIKDNPSAGVDFVLDLRKNFPGFSNKKVVFISNFAQMPMEQQLQEIEDNYIWLSKPFEMLELDQAIQEVKTNG